MVNKYCQSGTVITLIGNKNDLKSKREIDKKYAEDFAKNSDYSFFECSSYSNYNVSNSIVFTVKEILDKSKKGYKLSQVSDSENYKLGNKSHMEESNKKKNDFCECIKKLFF